MPTDPLASFLSALQQSGILTRPQLEEVKNLLRTGIKDVKVLARDLVRRGWLTPYQVNQLARGRGKELQLGPYLLLALLGEGGMGQVFKARHRIMDRLVALKIIRAEHLAHPDVVKRFHREVKAAAQLIHPNVVIAHDAGQSGTTHFFVMELLEGTDLAHLVAEQGPLPPGPACNYVRQAALGLQCAHEHGMVHRDIKPQNLFLVKDTQTVKVLDMGLARLRAASEESSAPMTREGAIMGTPDYLAPEQAVDASKVDIRSDIYSLGCTLYHLLAGEPPFAGGSLIQKIYRHQQNEPPAIESVRSDLPAGLAPIVHKMVAKRPEDRFQTPAEAAAALAVFAEATVPDPEPVSVNARWVPDPVATDAIAEVEPAPAQVKKIDPAVAAMPTLVPPQTVAPPPDSLTAPGIHAKSGPRDGPKRRLLILAGASAALLLAVTIFFVVRSFSGPDKKSLPTQPIASDYNPPEDITGQIRSIDKDKLELKDNASCLALSHDGRRVLVGAGKQIAAWDLEMGKKIHHLVGHQSAVTCVAFSPDGKQALSGSEDQTLRLWDLATGKESRLLEGHQGTVYSVAFSSNGEQALSGSIDKTVRLWNLATGQYTHVLQKNEKSIYAVAFRPGTNYVLSGGSDDKIRSWDLINRKALDPELEGHTMQVDSIAISADGSRALSGSGDKTVRLWDLKNSKELGCFDKHEGYVKCVAISPDGSRGLSGGDDKRVFLLVFPTNPVDGAKIEPIQDLYRLTLSKTSVVGVAFFPGGRHAISLDEDGTLRVWGLPR